MKRLLLAAIATISAACVLVSTMTQPGATAEPPEVAAETASPAGHEKPAINYAKALDSAVWRWEPEMASPLYCVTQCGNKYDIQLLSKKDDRYSLIITILADGKEVYRWKGHRHSVFRILEDRLYYARFHFSGSGGTIVAVDLKSGKELWASPLKALGPVEHSAYLNLMTLTAGFDEVVIHGNESMGRYVELKSVATGQTLAHKTFPKDEPQNQPDGQ